MLTFGLVGASGSVVHDEKVFGILEGIRQATDSELVSDRCFVGSEGWERKGILLTVAQSFKIGSRKGSAIFAARLKVLGGSTCLSRYRILSRCLGTSNCERNQKKMLLAATRNSRLLGRLGWNSRVDSVDHDTTTFLSRALP